MLCLFIYCHIREYEYYYVSMYLNIHMCIYICMYKYSKFEYEYGYEYEFTYEQGFKYAYTRMVLSFAGIGSVPYKISVQRPLRCEGSQTALNAPRHSLVCVGCQECVHVCQECVLHNSNAAAIEKQGPTSWTQCAVF